MSSCPNSWSFMEFHCKKSEEGEGENVYVHPTVKRSTSMLSSKSLEMCTENLGCETGSNGSDDISLFSSEFSSCVIGEAVNRDSNSVCKRLNKGRNKYPPILTSLTDSGRVQVRPHREFGRLILEAVTSCSPPLPYFEGERSNGRLRLRLFHSFDEEEEEECDESEEYIGNEEDGDMKITNFARLSRCNQNGNTDIFHIPSLSLCLLSDPIEI
ncbi:hypothetical protein Lal_00000421 [Lupinus albus]|uniref:Putative The fantastic four family protein n=1 Tax=Lupinus albus TaxID=3870 RepID=A0A6A4N4C2_LUPAL|nr:putative The fantastic four family protein [Lupinus albus]KAF1861005.1 hypothetical protein Lal_00000421 [Lupinus albus]